MEIEKNQSPANCVSRGAHIRWILIKLPSVKFLFKFYTFDVKQIYTRTKKPTFYIALVFACFVSFFCWNGIKRTLNKRRHKKNGCRKTFLTEVTGNKVSDHYSTNIKFLKVVVPLILVTSKYFIKGTLMQI